MVGISRGLSKTKIKLEVGPKLCARRSHAVGAKRSQQNGKTALRRSKLDIGAWLSITPQST